MLYTEKEKNEIERVRKGVCRTSNKALILNCYGLTKWAMSGWHWPKPGILIPELDRVCRRSLSRVPG